MSLFSWKVALRVESGYMKESTSKQLSDAGCRTMPMTLADVAGNGLQRVQGTEREYSFMK